MHEIRINDSNCYKHSSDSGLEIESISFNSKGEAIIKNKHIANFFPRVVAKVDVNIEGVVTPHEKLALEFADGKTGESKILPFKNLEKVNWSDDVDPRCILNPDVPKAGGHIANVIRLQCAKADVKTETMTVVDQFGGHSIEGVPVFHTGGELIWPEGLTDENKPKVIFKPVPHKQLAVDPNCSEREADAAMERIVDLSPDAGRAILSLNSMCIQWDAFEAAGITPRCNVYLYGKTGTKKTTYASFTTQMYNRDKLLERPDRLNASIPAAVKLMNKVRHGVLVLDDLYPADSSEIRRQQEKTLLEITRIIADGTEPARVRGGQVTKNPPRCGILGTGEYYIGGGSDAVRLFPIEIKTPIDCGKLTACQLEPLMLSTYYYYYIGWYITNFGEIVGLLKEWKAAYLEQAAKTGVHDRLQETEFCLEAAYKLYLTYRHEKGFISSEEVREYYHSFYEQLRAIVIEQNERAKQRKGAESQHQVDYLSVIRSLHREQCFNISDSAKQFKRKIHDGVIHKDCLYFRKDKLMDKIYIYEPEAEFKDVIVDLKLKQALSTNKHGTSKQLHGAGTGLRFYAIKLCKLR